MLRRPRPGGGRHPPPLAPTVSNFKPRAQWSTLESSMFLNVNLPGFYMDQINIKKDERARTIHIEGQRPLSTQTKARFNEVYRVPDSCDMKKLTTSFSHGLLTIEFPVVVESEKAGKAGQDQGKTVQRPNHEGNRGTGPSDGSSVRRSRLSDKEKQVGTNQENAAPTARKEEPKTYKSVVEGKREVPAATRVKTTEEKVKEGESSPSLGRKEHTKQEKVVEKKEVSQVDQQKTVQKVKDEEARSRPTVGGSLKDKVPAKEEKAVERNKDGDFGKKKTEQKVKEEGDAKTSTIGGNLEHKVHAKAEKVVERKGDGEIGQKLKEEGKTGVGQKKEEKHTKPGAGDEARRSENEISALNPEPKMKERVERTSRNVNGNMITKNDEKMVGEQVSKGEIQEGVREKKVEKEAGLVKETRVSKDNPQVVVPNIKVDSGGPVKKESTIGGEKMVEKRSEPDTDPSIVKGQKKTNMNSPAAEGSGLEMEESQKYNISLINVGVASLVIMGFGAYVFVPLVKKFY